MHPIRRYRTAKGLTQKDLALAMAVTYQTVQFWEGGAVPRPKHMAKLAEVLGVDALQLVNELEAWRKDEGKATT